MKFRAVVVFLGAVLATMTIAAEARADTFTIGLQLGASDVPTFEGNRTWRPTLALDASVNLVGPLRAGAFFQMLGEELPLSDPAYGGGFALSVRQGLPAIPLIFYGEASIGIIEVPGDQSPNRNAWTMNLGGGAAYDAGMVDIETRFTHRWYNGRGGDQVDGRGWSITAGITLGF